LHVMLTPMERSRSTKSWFVRALRKVSNQSEEALEFPKNVRDLARLGGLSLLTLPERFSTNELVIPTCFAATGNYIIEHGEDIQNQAITASLTYSRARLARHLPYTRPVTNCRRPIRPLSPTDPSARRLAFEDRSFESRGHSSNACST